MVRDLGRATGGILSYFTRHNTAANLLLVVLVVAGFYAIPQMRAQFFPDVIVDDMTIDIQWDGAGAEDVDASIVEVLQSTLITVDGVAFEVEGHTSGSGGWDC